MGRQTRPDLEQKKGTMLKLGPVANIPRTLACMIKKRLLLLNLYINLIPPFLFYSVYFSLHFFHLPTTILLT